MEMFRNRFGLLGAVLGLSVLMLATPASAWEFKMTGSYVWQYGYRSQLGNGGFFGPYDVDNQAAPNLQAVNAWLGTHSNQLQSFQTGVNAAFNPAEIVVSGHDGGWDTMWMDSWIELRMNPAVRVRGLYHIGEWASTTGTQPTTGFQQGEGALVQSEYQNQRYPGVKRSFSPGYWNLLWLTAQLPWGELLIGKRPSSFGTGLMWNGEDSRTSESFSLFTLYGPLRIGASLYWARTGSEGYTTDPFDKSGFRSYDLTQVTTYRNGPLDAGYTLNWLKRHRGGDRRNVTGVSASKNADYRDRNDFYGGVYTKYNNGRFFFNAELDFYDRIDRLGRQAFFNADPDRSADLYMQHYRFMTELGFLCGPAKMSLLYSWSSGNDRRGALANGVTSGGIPNINQGTLNEPTNPVTGGLVQGTTASNTGLYRPYSYLMVYAYGLGTHIEGDTGNGYVEDASCYGARLDYAVASNLNLYGSFFWADRVGNAYGWGFLKPATLGAQPGAVVSAVTPLAGPFPLTTTTTTLPFAATFPATNGIASGYVAGAPTIPDNNLGWEFDSGFDWKLLENLTLNATFAYWQPGKWFNFACIDKNVPAWSVQTAVNSFGINPNRSIDRIFAVDLKIVADF
jgi:hypothetical protein